MMAVPFDTLKLAKGLQAAGFSPDQASRTAEALAEAMDGSEPATKGDLALLRRDLESDREILRRDLTIRMGGMVIAGASIVLAGVRLML